MNTNIVMMTREEYGYGYLYNWYAASHVDFAPDDWALPSQAQFTTLTTYLGGTSVAGAKLMKTNTRTFVPNLVANNDSGFSAKGAGDRSATSPYNFGSDTFHAEFWINLANGGNGWLLRLNANSSGTTSGYLPKGWGYSVRLIYTGATAPSSTMTDYDGHVYDVIQIGTQYWIQQNWKCTKLNDGTPMIRADDNVLWSALTNLNYCAFDKEDYKV